MPEDIPIRERIIRNVKTACETIPGVGTVYRANPAGQVAGTESYTTRDVVVVDLGEDVSPDEQADGYWVSRRLMTVAIGFVFIPDPESVIAPSDQRNRFAAAVEVAALSNPTWASGTPSVPLAQHTHIEEVEEPEFADGRWYCGVTLIIEYRHEYGNPYRYSTAIPVLSE